MGAAYKGGGAKADTEVMGDEEGATEVMGLEDMVDKSGENEVVEVLKGEPWRCCFDWEDLVRVCTPIERCSWQGAVWLPGL